LGGIGGSSGDGGMLDCNGTPGGTAVEDCFGVCGGTAVEDCLRVCNRSALVDDCGVCDGNNADKDCAGVCFGSAEYDCDGKECGPDECGGSCPPGCSGAKVCNGTGHCVWPSCATDQSGADNSCGPGGDEDCCSSPLVTGGTYYRSYDAVYFTDDSYPATVSDFRLDRFEVTVGRFRAFVEAGKGTQADPPAAGDGEHPFNPGSGWDAAWNTSLAANTGALSSALLCSSTYQTWTPTAGANEHLPITCVMWYEAMAFCAWDGGWLPTEAEWNYAAAGGDEQRHYPWSSPATDTTIDGTYAVYDCMGDGSASEDCSFNDILSVGSRSPKGDGLWAQADLGGNMWEWNLDWWATYVNPCNDCANLASASYRVFRGGSWFIDPYNLRAAGRLRGKPTVRVCYLGFRCARTPQQ
jgi:formylglycine-generating enzyme required for sulfatase activity